MILHESIIESIIKDIVTFSLMGFLFWFNLKFIDGNNFIDTFIFLAIFGQALRTVGNKKTSFTNAKEAIEHIENFYSNK